ncbi:hypothetical protein P5G51_008560 [Virgibacillus sp. 179-BFC.A HS]|uniref:Uncharacterized protein n=1 Tax=Tigheibacillus jepli TaxID=3035914 RepID=A0ABU5CGI4_9BACI|nr:hypothetical protein [Virgibacillus sp. 179-BFC.A HS]MDY0405442.1 hypothetical protein [Virgibacillus sp. 179-BFC.A HS]
MQKTGWLIYRKTDATTNHTFIQWFLEEAKKQNVNLQLVIREELQIGIQQNKYKLWIRHHPVKSPDFAIVRTIEPQLNTFLEQMDIFVFNSAETSCICNHKGLTHMAVKKLHVPMVDTIFTTTDSLSSIPPMPFPFVIKSRRKRWKTGACGKGRIILGNAFANAA